METDIAQVWADEFDKTQVRDLIARLVVRAEACFDLAKEAPEMRVKMALVRDMDRFRTPAQNLAHLIGDPPPVFRPTNPQVALVEEVAEALGAQIRSKGTPLGDLIGPF